MKYIKAKKQVVWDGGQSVIHMSMWFLKGCAVFVVLVIGGTPGVI